MTRYYRKVFRIRAEDSPNVRLGLWETDHKKVPSGKVIIPGVLPWADYVKRRNTWDKIRQCIGLDAEFYEGAEVLLFPPEWLNRAERMADSLKGIGRVAKSLGVDPAEGGDETVFCIIDELGIIDLIAIRTPDTSIITGQTIALINQYKIPHYRVMFDRGGGGKEHADRLRQQGFNVQTVAFGESVVPPIRKKTPNRLDVKVDEKEDRYVYKNRRAQMYGMLHNLLDPSYSQHGFAIPGVYNELRRQLSPMPKIYDAEGRLEMLPKTRKNKDDNRRTLTDIIGCSPDQADALVLAVYGMEQKPRTVVVGAVDLRGDTGQVS